MLLCSLLQLLIIWYKFFHFIFIQCFCSKVEHKSLFLRDLIYFHYFVVFNRQNAWFQAISDGQNFYCYIIQISQIAVFLFLFPYSTATNTWSSWSAESELTLQYAATRIFCSCPAAIVGWITVTFGFISAPPIYFFTTYNTTFLRKLVSPNPTKLRRQSCAEPTKAVLFV